VSSVVPGCFGRLRGDVLRPPADDPDLPALEAALTAAAPLRFLHRSPRTGRVFAGAVSEGPFVVFGRLDVRPGDLDPSLLPLLASPFLDRAEAVRQARDVGSLAAPLDLEAARQACLAYVAETRGGEFWTGIFGTPDDARRHALAALVAEAAAAGRAIRLPRASAGEADVCFWLELARRLRRSPELPPLTAWDRRGLTIVFDGLRAADALDVVAEAGRRPAGRPHPGLVGDAGAPLSSLLQALSAR
jgi:hypothetical protein